MMEQDEFIELIRAGKTREAIDGFLKARPDLNLETIAVSVINAGMTDVAINLLQIMAEEKPTDHAINMQLAIHLYRAGRYSEAIEPFKVYRDGEPDNPSPYTGLGFGYSQSHKPDALRELYDLARKNIRDGRYFNWQAGKRIFRFLPIKDEIISQFYDLQDAVDADLRDTLRKTRVSIHRPFFKEAGKARLTGWSNLPDIKSGSFEIDKVGYIDAERDVTGQITSWSCDTLIPVGEAWRVRLVVSTTGDTYRSDWHQVDAVDAINATLTGAAEAISTDKATVSGAVAATEADALYRFEVGYQVDELFGASGWEALPGAVNASYVRDERFNSVRTILYAAEVSIDQESRAPVLHWPFGKDNNHISGAGFIDLVYGHWPTSANADGKEPPDKSVTPDLRGGTLQLDLSFDTFEAQDFLYTVAISSPQTYWMLSDCVLEAPTSSDSKECSVRWDLSTSPERWTYFGNNPIEQTDYDRYSYGPLNDVATYLVNNVTFFGAFGDWRHAPRGSISIERLSLTYHCRSILHPDNGATLLKWPKSSPLDPWTLTNGCRGETEEIWCAELNGRSSAQFSWRLARPYKITTLIFCQSIAHPTETVLVEFRLAEKAIISTTITLPTDPDRRHEMIPIVAKLPEPLIADTISMALHPVPGQDIVALESVEVFADDYIAPPTSTPTTVSADIELDRERIIDKTIYYRVIMMAGDQTQFGEIRSLPMPSSEKPILLNVSMAKKTNALVILKIRGNAMGKWTELNWHAGSNREWSGTISFGGETTPSHRYITLRAKGGRMPEAVQIWLKSDAGVSRREALDLTADCAPSDTIMS